MAPLLCIDEPVLGAKVLISCSYWAACAAGFTSLTSWETIIDSILQEIDVGLNLSMSLVAACYVITSSIISGVTLPFYSVLTIYWLRAVDLFSTRETCD